MLHRAENLASGSRTLVSIMPIQLALVLKMFKTRSWKEFPHHVPSNIFRVKSKFESVIIFYAPKIRTLLSNPESIACAWISYFLSEFPSLFQNGFLFCFFYGCTPIPLSEFSLLFKQLRYKLQVVKTVLKGTNIIVAYIQHLTVLVVENCCEIS